MQMSHQSSLSGTKVGKMGEREDQL